MIKLWKKRLFAKKRARVIWIRHNKKAWLDCYFERGSGWSLAGYWGNCFSVEMNGWDSASSGWGNKTKFHMRRLMRLHRSLRDLGHEPTTDWH